MYTQCEQTTPLNITRCLAAVVLALVPASAAAVEGELNEKTPLDEYVLAEDPSYRWTIHKQADTEELRVVTVEMVSQNWLTAEEVDRTEWRHWLTIWIPQSPVSDVGLLFVTGGSNDDDSPAGDDQRLVSMSRAANSVVAELRMVPNQPLVFHQDGVPRYEDDLIAYSWVQFLDTRDSRWLPRGPMVKAAVRALDTVSAVVRSLEPATRSVERFVVAGGSKRGWVTWLVGAMDPRVVAIAPIVIDVANIRPSIRHHFAAYGYWAQAMGDYVFHGIMQRESDPALSALYAIVDPYTYRSRLTHPKLVINASGDQYFLPDSSQFYWSDLKEPKYLRYVPNSPHSLEGTDGIETLTAFFALIAAGGEIPTIEWSGPTATLCASQPVKNPLQFACGRRPNPYARDFRVSTFGRKYQQQLLNPHDDGTYTASVVEPDQGWTAWFVEVEFDAGVETPFKLSTEVRVVPDTLPFAGKPSDLQNSLTLSCIANRRSDGAP